MSGKGDDFEVVTAVRKTVSGGDGREWKVEIHVVIPGELVGACLDLLPCVRSPFFCDSDFTCVGAAHIIVLIKTMVAVGRGCDLYRIHERPGAAVGEKGDIAAVVYMIVGHEDVEIPAVDGELVQGLFHLRQTLRHVPGGVDHEASFAAFYNIEVSG